MGTTPIIAITTKSWGHKRTTKESIAMTKHTNKSVSREFFRAYRYEMTLEALQLILTDDGWFKIDLADYLGVEYDHLNKLLTRRYYPVDTQLMHRVKRLYQRKYGRQKWHTIAKNIRSLKLSYLKQSLDDEQNRY